MDIFLGRITSQAMNYAIRSGVTITASYALKQSARLLRETPRSQQREELMRLQLRLESKIRIVSPAIDMIDLISARGNTTLESALSLTKEIRYAIQRLGTRLSEAANEEELLQRQSKRAKSRDDIERGLKVIIADIKQVLMQIEDAVPLINLAITTSGVNLSTKLSGTISPSRLLQASTFLTAADTRYTAKPASPQQVGPTCTLSLYMLFAGHAWRPADEEGVRETTWKEVIHKAKVKLVRVPLHKLYNLPGDTSVTNGIAGESVPSDATAAEFAYQLVLLEDLDDDRVHTFEDDQAPPGPFDEVANAGIRDVIPIHEISKVFYADTGKLLNIGGDTDTNNPVLLFRRDVHAEPPRRMLHRSQMSNPGYHDEVELKRGIDDDDEDEQSEIDAQLYRESAPSTPQKDPQEENKSNDSWRLPSDLDPEWMAFEVYAEDPATDSDSDDSPETSHPPSRRADSLGPTLTSALSSLTLHSSPQSTHRSPLRPHPTPQIKSSLSLLEMLTKLTALQQFRQDSHLTIEDELLNFFLEDSATAGAGADKEYRQTLRHEAVRRVGFDPYDESPIKRRGEEYIRGARGGASPRPSFDVGGFVGNEHLDDEQTSPSQSTPHFALPSIEPRGHLSLSPQTPIRPSAPSRVSSETHRTAVRAKYGNSKSPSSPQAPLLATPPNTKNSRQAYKRAQSEPLGRSPLAREVVVEASENVKEVEGAV